jgi:hypothetical protein
VPWSKCQRQIASLAVLASRNRALIGSHREIWQDRSRPPFRLLVKIGVSQQRSSPARWLRALHIYNRVRRRTAVKACNWGATQLRDAPNRIHPSLYPNRCNWYLVGHARRTLSKKVTHLAHAVDSYLREELNHFSDSEFWASIAPRYPDRAMCRRLRCR